MGCHAASAAQALRQWLLLSLVWPLSHTPAAPGLPPPFSAQRVPATESAGRVHTSAASVAVLPAPGELDVVLQDADVRVDVYRSGGAGGQHVNTTNSAVRVTHLPTGVSVCIQVRPGGGWRGVPLPTGASR